MLIDMLYSSVTTCNRICFNVYWNVNILQNEQIQVEQANEFIFHIKDGMKTFIINMDEKTCTCIKFQID